MAAKKAQKKAGKKAASRRRRGGLFQRPGSPFWWGDYTDAKGERKRESLGVRLDSGTGYMDAKDELAKRRARARELRETGQAAPSKDALATILPRYLKHQKVRLSPESYLRTEGIVNNHLEPYFGQMPMNSISRDTISQYASQRAEQTSPATVVKELNILKHLLNLMVDEWKLIAFNPAARLKPPRRVPAGRVRYLQPTELRAVIDACPAWLKGIVSLAAFTAMRRGEVLGLRWMHVDLTGNPRNRLMLPQTKNGEGRIVYLNALATDVLRAQWSEKAKPGDLVFPQAAGFSPDNVSKGFATVARRLKLENIHFHDLRHTAASWMRMQGADVHTIAQILGHKDMRMATRYQHLSPGFLSDAVGTLDTLFAHAKQLTEGQPNTH